jgi:hypothetical protein
LTRHTNLLPPSILSMNSTQLNKVLILLQVIIEDIDLWNCFVKVDVLFFFSSCLRKREASLNCCRSFIMNSLLMEWQLRIFFVFSWLTKHCRIMRYFDVFDLTAKLTCSASHQIINALVVLFECDSTHDIFRSPYLSSILSISESRHHSIILAFLIYISQKKKDRTVSRMNSLSVVSPCDNWNHIVAWCWFIGLLSRNLSSSHHTSRPWVSPQSQ